MLGIAVLSTVFTSHGGYGSPQAFVHGMTPALWVGTAVLGVGALTALALPFNSRATALAQAEVETAERQRAQATGAQPAGLTVA